MKTAIVDELADNIFFNHNTFSKIIHEHISTSLGLVGWDGWGNFRLEM